MTDLIQEAFETLPQSTGQLRLLLNHGTLSLDKAQCQLRYYNGKIEVRFHLEALRAFCFLDNTLVIEGKIETMDECDSRPIPDKS